MDLLLLAPQLPYPPHQGTSLRNYHIIRGLAENNRISLLSYGAGGPDDVIPPQLSMLCDEVRVVAEPSRTTMRRVWQMLTSSKPDMALRLLTAEFAGALMEMLQKRAYQVVQIEGIELAWTIPLVRQVSPAARLVYDAHNAETLLQARAGRADRGTVTRWPAVLYSAMQSSRLRGYETWVVSSVNAVTAVSEADRDALLDLTPYQHEITVIPNSIDVVEYGESTRSVAAAGREASFDVVFGGKMDYRPNVDAVLWFADAVWPKVLEQNPDARWAIVGQQPHDRLARLAAVPGVTITGWVPDIVPYLAGAKVFVMPFRVGSGTRLKLIEALAAGRAVVSTNVGVEGFPVENGREVLIADSAEEFAASVSRLLRDETLRSQLGQQGLRFAQGYDWRVLVPRFEAVYRRLAAGNDDSAD